LAGIVTFGQDQESQRQHEKRAANSHNNTH
jgi:hypothetical protein